MPRRVQSERLRLILHAGPLGGDTSLFMFPDMKGALGVIGVFLSFLCGEFFPLCRRTCLNPRGGSDRTELQRRFSCCQWERRGKDELE